MEQNQGQGAQEKTHKHRNNISFSGGAFFEVQQLQKKGHQRVISIGEVEPIEQQENTQDRFSQIVEDTCEVTQDNIHNIDEIFSPMKIDMEPKVRMTQKSWPLLPNLFKFFNSFGEEIDGLMLVFLDFLTLNDYIKIKNLNSRGYFSNSMFFQFGKIKQHLLYLGNGMGPTLRLNFYRACFKPSFYNPSQQLSLTFKNNRLLPIAKMSKKHFDILNQIHIDLLRTRIPFSQSPLTQDTVLQCMNILYQICCVQIPEMGYCQGLNYLASVFHHVTQGESQNTHQVLLGFIQSRGLKGVFMNKVYCYHVKNFVMQKLMKENMPQLWSHFVKKLQINIEMITTQWLMTFLIGFIDTKEYLMPYLDKLILGNDNVDFWTQVYASIFAILQVNQAKLLEMNDISQIAIFFQLMGENQQLGFKNAREFMAKSVEIQGQINQINKCQELEDEYFLQLAIKQIEDEKKYKIKNIFASEKSSSEDFDLIDSKFLSDVRDQIKEIQSSKKPEINHFTEKIHQIDKQIYKIEKKNKQIIKDYEQNNQVDIQYKEEIKHLETIKMILKKEQFIIKQVQKMQTFKFQIFKKQRTIDQQNNYVIYLESNPDIKEQLTPSKRLQKSIKKAFKQFITNKKEEEEVKEKKLEVQEVPKQHQIQFIKNKIQIAEQEIVQLKDQIQKTKVQVSQIKYSSDYLIKNLFKELADSTSTTKTSQKAKNSKDKLRHLSNTQMIYYSKKQIQIMREYTFQIINHAESSDDSSSDDDTKTIGEIQQNIEENEQDRVSSSDDDTSSEQVVTGEFQVDSSRDQEEIKEPQRELTPQAASKKQIFLEIDTEDDKLYQTEAQKDSRISIQKVSNVPKVISPLETEQQTQLNQDFIKALRSYTINLDYLQNEINMRFTILTMKLKNQETVLKDLIKPYQRVTQEIEGLMQQKNQSMDHVKGIAELKSQQICKIQEKCGQILKEQHYNNLY